MSIQHSILKPDGFLQMRGGTLDAMRTANPLLARREIAVELDTGNIKVGDGSHYWNELPYAGNGNLFIVDDLTTGGSGYALSAEQGKILKSLIDNFNAADYIYFHHISADDREHSNYVPKVGEPFFEVETGHLFIGNGVNSLAELTYIGESESAKPISITTSYMPDATVGQDYSCMFQCSESLWVSWEISTSKIIVPSNDPITHDVVYLDFDYATGFEFSDNSVTIKETLPDGLSFNPSNGLLSGIPSATGTFSISVTAKRGSARNNRNFIFNINN